MAGSAVQRYMLALEHEQEVIGVISNLVMAVYAMESVLLRTQKKLANDCSRRPTSPELPWRAHTSTKRPIAWRWKRGAALARIAEGDTLRTHLSVLRRFLRRTPPDSIGLKRQLADRALEMNRYPFS